MNAANPQQRFIERLHEADDEALETLLHHRLGGKGPAVQDGESRSIVLEHSVIAGSTAYRQRLRAALLNLLADFSRPSAFRRVDADNGRWRLLMGALELAANFDWPPGDPRDDLNQCLRGWMHTLADGSFPRPRDSWKEDRIQGYPETDLAAMVLQLAARNLDWTQALAAPLWAHSYLDQTTAKESCIRAARRWRLARWALLDGKTKALDWLAKHIDKLSQTLEAADWYPGDLTRLFLIAEIEIEIGPERVAQLILRVPTPPEPSRRKELALQLDYFGEENLDVRRALIGMRNETSASTAQPTGLIYVPSAKREPTETESIAEAYAYSSEMGTGQTVNPAMVVKTKFATFSEPAARMH